VCQWSCDHEPCVGAVAVVHSYTPGFREFDLLTGVSVVEETGAAEDECSHTSPVGH